MDLHRHTRRWNTCGSARLRRVHVSRRQDRRERFVPQEPRVHAGLNMANTEWWQRGPIDGVPAVLQPIAHILFQVRESVGEIVAPLTEHEWNARPAGVASAAFHVRHIAGVIDRLFTYARGKALSTEQMATLRAEREPHLAATEVAAVLQTLDARVESALAELRTIDPAILGQFRGVG